MMKTGIIMLYCAFAAMARPHMSRRAQEYYGRYDYAPTEKEALARHEDLYLPEHQLPDQYCVVDQHGHFGEVTGEAQQLIYSYGLETGPGADLESVFQAIGKSVENVLLAASFPHVCGYRINGESSRRLNAYPVHGFKFDHMMTQTRYACVPEKSADANCDVYQGSVLVFGEVGLLHEVVEFHLSVDDGSIHSDILRIFAVDQEGRPINGGSVAAPQDSSGSSSGGLKTGAIVGILISIVALAIGVAGFIWFQRQQQHEIEHYGDPDADINLATGESDHYADPPAGFTTVDLGNGSGGMEDDGREEYYASRHEFD